MAQNTSAISPETEDTKEIPLAAVIGVIVAAIVVLAGGAYLSLWVLAVLHSNDWTLPGLVPLMHAFWAWLEGIPFPEALGPVTTQNLN